MRERRGLKGTVQNTCLQGLDMKLSKSSSLKLHKIMRFVFEFLDKNTYQFNVTSNFLQVAFKSFMSCTYTCYIIDVHHSSKNHSFIVKAYT